MQSSSARVLPGGPARRHAPAGVQAGAPLSRIRGPVDALALVQEDLARAEVALRELVHSEVAAIPPVAGYLVDAGGKRLRPALTALGARAIGLEHAPARLMCVGELLHLGSLLHDDVVDDGLTRRGLTATHRVYGNAVTVLTGDFCLARSVLLASEEGGHTAVTALGHAVTAMAEGEVLQLQRAGNLATDLDAYLETITKKSAALIAWCAAAAAYMVGDDPAAAALERYGRGVGVAFQITDDVLDYRPGTGKSPGTDLRERKVTLPLMYAFEADPQLRADLSAAAPTDATLPHYMDRVRDTGALDRALDYARELVSESVAALDALPEGEGRDALRVLGTYLVERAA